MIYGGKTGFADLNDVVFEAHAKLSPYLDRFDSIAVSGTSGLVVGAPVAVLLNKPLVVVRKTNDGSHNEDVQMVEGSRNMGSRVLFLDDFVGTGRTRAWVRKNVVEEGADLVGEYDYNSTNRGVVKWYGGEPWKRSEYYRDVAVPPSEEFIPW